MKSIGLKAEILIKNAKRDLNDDSTFESNEELIKIIAMMIEDNNKAIFETLKNNTDIIRDTVNP